MQYNTAVLKLMDPLSVIASSIAVVQGTDRLVSLLAKARRMKEAPVEVDYLLTEVSQAKTTLASLRGIMLTFAERGAGCNLDAIHRVLPEYAALIHEIDCLVEKHLVTATPTGQDLSAKAMEHPAYHGGNGSSFILQMQDSMEHRLAQQEKVLNQILLAQTETLSTSSSIVSSATLMSRHPLPSTQPYETAAIALCSPFLGKGCNLTTCKRPSIPTARGAFYLPHWFASRVVLFTLVNGSSPSFSLRIARLISAQSEFFRYIQTGRCDKVQELLEAGQASPGDMAELSYGTLSALLFALNSGQIQVCKILLSWGADPNLEHDTSLTSSATEMAWAMAQEGGFSQNVNEDDRLENMFPFPQDLLERRQFSRLTNIVLGLSGYNLDAALKVATTADFADTDRHGRTVVHWAGWKGNAQEMRKILLAGGDPDVADPGGRVPLHFSAMTSTSACTAVLAELGADVNKADRLGERPLHCACSTNRWVNVACLLSSGADANAATQKGTTPLMSAVLCGSIDVVEMLLRQGVDVEATDCAGESAATLAVWVNRHDILFKLASLGRARLDVITCSGRTILHTAAQYGDIRMVETLLGLPLGANSSAALNHEGLTAMEKLRERNDLTQELTEAFGALVLKTGYIPATTTTNVDFAGDVDEALQNSEASSVFSEDVFSPAMESLRQ
ncbi:ankyrin repeat protein [Apiospora rasikravindrae]|uniref:Ankyrin repeat protein n=1 Tax=Apiospora rasikravindrae TaxID=990691 RepID=A0ABR1S2K4_9PEZI